MIKPVLDFFKCYISVFFNLNTLFSEQSKYSLCSYNGKDIFFYVPLEMSIIFCVSSREKTFSLLISDSLQPPSQLWTHTNIKQQHWYDIIPHTVPLISPCLLLHKLHDHRRKMIRKAHVIPPLDWGWEKGYDSKDKSVCLCSVGTSMQK